METLNHIIIYHPVFSSVINCCICSLCCMINSVQMVALHFNLNYICNKLFLLLCLEFYKHQKTTKLNPNTPWMKKIYKKTININYYFFLPSMNHSKFMEIQYIYELSCPIYFSRFLIPIFDILCHFQSSCICRTGGSNHL
jgi:hypothetical protein